MTLKKVKNHFKSSLSNTSKKSEIKFYEEFIQILTSLEKKNLSEVEIQSIEKVLDNLNLNSTGTNNKRFLNQALKHFKKYLKDSYSFTYKGYYTNIGFGLGASFGVLFGVVLLSDFERSLGISLGVTFGMLIGLIIGQNMDSQAKTLGKML
ncbi:hypothetical protein [Snuella lapsa]|uniref:Glycine zipper family protein n=1 Tax=Snuella lapsa TaxID=870481 RepID=A0ABP6YFV2_9FLAO